MNRSKLRELEGEAVRLRPIARRVVPGTNKLPGVDDLWRIGSDCCAGAIVRLHNRVTGHFFDVYSDSVQEFREPNTL